MIVVPSAPNPVLYRAWAASRNLVDAAPPSDAQAAVLSRTSLPAQDGIADGYFLLPPSASPRAIKLFLGSTVTGAGLMAGRVTGFNPTKFLSTENTTQSPDLTVNKVRWSGEVLFEGTVAKNASSTPSELANGTSEPLFLSAAVWTVTHGSSSNLIQLGTVNVKHNTPIIVPTNGCRLIFVETWRVTGGEGNANALVGFMG